MQSQPSISTEQLLDLLAALAHQLETITTNGIVLGESNDELHIQDLQHRIQSHKTDLLKLQTQLKKVRDIIKRRRALLKKPK